MRKVLCSIGAGAHEELLELSGQTFAIYAERHGYDLELVRTLSVPERSPAWNKLPLFRDLLSRYDLVFWVDADAAIVDPTLDIADELGRRDLMGMVAHHYEGQEIPNCGIWVLRRDPRVLRFLDRLWNRTEYLDHEWWENAALLDEFGYTVEPRVELVRRSRMRSRTRYVDRSWNSIQIDPADRPRINHYPGRSQGHRVQQLTRDLETARSIAVSLSRDPRPAG